MGEHYEIHLNREYADLLGVLKCETCRRHFLKHEAHDCPWCKLQALSECLCHDPFCVLEHRERIREITGDSNG